MLGGSGGLQEGEKKKQKKHKTNGSPEQLELSAQHHSAQLQLQTVALKKNLVRGFDEQLRGCGAK